jgi:hypothetical protein
VIEVEAIMGHPTSVYSCDWEVRWLWVEGWVNKRKFKGKCISHGFGAESDSPDEDRGDIIRAKVHHGWIISVAGDASGCGWDATSWLVDDEPHVVDGKWLGPPEDQVGGTEFPAEVVDGPRKVTWLEV